MGAINKNLFGLWKMTEMRFKNAEGNWENETVIGGSSMFTESGHIITFTRTNELPFGYSGTFVIKGNDLVIKPEAASIDDLERATIIRTVREVSEKALVLEMTDDATGRNYQIEFVPITRTFS